jgi:hypothetical protein
MESDPLIVVDLNAIAERWELPISVIQHFIVDCDMPVEEEKRGEWFDLNSDLVLEEKRKYFEDLLFPRELRPEPSETSL